MRTCDQLVSGTFCGYELEPGVMHGYELEPGTMHGYELEPGVMHAQGFHDESAGTSTDASGRGTRPIDPPMANDGNG